jgi:chorismate mutase
MYNVRMDEIETLRDGINSVDAQLIGLLGERFRLTREVGKLKAQYNLPPADPAREALQMERYGKLAIELGLNPDHARQFFRFIIEEVKRNHAAQAALDVVNVHQGAPE